MLLSAEMRSRQLGKALDVQSELRRRVAAPHDDDIVIDDQSFGLLSDRRARRARRSRGRVRLAQESLADRACHLVVATRGCAALA